MRHFIFGFVAVLALQIAAWAGVDAAVPEGIRAGHVDMVTGDAANPGTTVWRRPSVKVAQQGYNNRFSKSGFNNEGISDSGFNNEGISDSGLNDKGLSRPGANAQYRKTGPRAPLDDSGLDQPFADQASPASATRQEPASSAPQDSRKTDAAQVRVVPRSEFIDVEPETAGGTGVLGVAAQDSAGELLGIAVEDSEMSLPGIAVD